MREGRHTHTFSFDSFLQAQLFALPFRFACSDKTTLHLLSKQLVCFKNGDMRVPRRVVLLAAKTLSAKFQMVGYRANRICRPLSHSKPLILCESPWHILRDNVMLGSSPCNHCECLNFVQIHRRLYLPDSRKVCLACKAYCKRNSVSSWMSKE